MGSNYYGEPSLGNGRSGSSKKGKKSNSDKPKQPQRGLGVAQLENIRLHSQMNCTYLPSLHHTPYHTHLNQEQVMRMGAPYSSSTTTFGFHPNGMAHSFDCSRESWGIPVIVVGHYFGTASGMAPRSQLDFMENSNLGLRFVKSWTSLVDRFTIPILGKDRPLVMCWRVGVVSIRAYAQLKMGLSLNIDMSSTAFIEPLFIIEFVSRLLNRDPAVQRPLSDADRVETVRRNDDQNDDYATEFGIKISDKLATVEARVLPPPLLKYHEMGREKDCLPTVGQWNMMNKAQGWELQLFSRVETVLMTFIMLGTSISYPMMLDRQNVT